MITPLPGVTATKPGSATQPIPGVFAEVVDDAGEPVEVGGGYLTITRPWPGMLRGIWGDPERYRDTYWSTYEGRYFAGDGAKIDADGYLWLLGRVDDVMNVSGHRISTAEIESALVDHPAVAEAAVVGATDDTTGQAIIGYVILRGGHVASDDLREEIRHHVGHQARGHRPTQGRLHRPRPAQDPLGQDHAATAARRRRRSGPRRHHHPGRLIGGPRPPGGAAVATDAGGLTHPRRRRWRALRGPGEIAVARRNRLISCRRCSAGHEQERR